MKEKKWPKELIKIFIENKDKIKDLNFGEKLEIEGATFEVALHIQKKVKI